MKMKDLNHRKHSLFRGAFNGICALILFIFFFHGETNQTGLIRRRIAFNSSSGDIEKKSSVRNPTVCTELHDHTGYQSRCEYLLANPQCRSTGFFDYTAFFYCDCDNYSYIGYIVLIIWMIALIYMLSNNASDYFGCCLKKLSHLLKLPPAVAGVALLPLGNGAPDVFSSIAAFVGGDAADVGLNSVLGGALFVTCVIVGTISVRVAGENVRIDKSCFVRDVCFFIVILISLLVIIFVGEVSVAGAIAFISIYAVYGLSVAANEMLRKNGMEFELDSVTDESVYVSVIDSESGNDVPLLQTKVPHWMWASNLGVVTAGLEEGSKPLWGWNEGEMVGDHSSFSCSKLCGWLELPLTLPRRLTIPIVEEERWSKGYAVASVTVAPVLLAYLWTTQENVYSLLGLTLYLVGGVIGAVLGVLAYTYTKSDHPPRRFLFPWVLGGFFMSIIWFYIIANELVAVLVTLGVVFAIKPSILGLTVLAWGNSMGDFVLDFSLATSGREGVQIAMSGCYAGPIFNIIAGLGISMLIGAWSKRPASYVVPLDASLYYTLGFLMLGLVWSLVVLPRNDMRPNKLLGIGLMVIYLVFLSLRVSMAMGGGSVDSF